MLGIKVRLGVAFSFSREFYLGGVYSGFIFNPRRKGWHGFASCTRIRFQGLGFMTSGSSSSHELLAVDEEGS